MRSLPFVIPYSSMSAAFLRSQTILTHTAPFARNTIFRISACNAFFLLTKRTIHTEGSLCTDGPFASRGAQKVVGVQPSMKVAKAINSEVETHVGSNAVRRDVAVICTSVRQTEGRHLANLSFEAKADRRHV